MTAAEVKRLLAERDAAIRRAEEAERERDALRTELESLRRACRLGAPDPDGDGLLPYQKLPLVRCAAGRDGDCFHPQCPQHRDGEPVKSGRHCPIDIREEEDDG